MIKNIMVAAIALLVGASTQNLTGLFDAYFDQKPLVYSKPFWYSVTLTDSTISYQAEGERFVECIHKAPVTADIMDSTGFVLSRELVRRNPNGGNEPVNGNIATMQSDKTIVGVPNDVAKQKPHRFKSNNFIIVTDKKTLETATEFIIRTECFNERDGRFLGQFGPFPIPANGETIGYFPDVVKSLYE